MDQVGSSNHTFIRIDAKVRTEIKIRGTSRTGIDKIVVTEDNTDKTEVGLDMNKIIGEETLEET